jgi:hypothetical protein
LYIFEGLCIENIRILFGIYLQLGLISRPFGIFTTILVYFTHFGLLYQEQSGNPDPNALYETYILLLPFHGCIKMESFSEILGGRADHEVDPRAGVGRDGDGRSAHHPRQDVPQGSHPGPGP